jgi:DNA polymerase
MGKPNLRLVTSGSWPNEAVVPELGLDFESRGVVDLRRSGAHRYAADADTDVLCAAFAEGDGEIESWIPGSPCPELMVRAAKDGWTIHAFNANFERLIWHYILTPRYGWPEPRLEQWRCTQAAALASALPDSLEGAAAALRLPFRKDPDGYAAMLRLSRPRKPRNDEDPAIIHWGGRDGDLELLYPYNRDDVEQERAVRRCVPPLSSHEQAVWCLDAEINDRGFSVDVGLATAKQEIVAQVRAAINAEIAALTGGAITTANQVAKIKAFVRKSGHQLKTLQKRSVSAVLARNPGKEVRQLLELRRDGGRLTKLAALFAHVGADNRIRGAFKYHGASTGRWSSTGFQVQNLKRIETKDFDTDAAIDAILTRDRNRVCEFGPPMTVIGDTARGLICAPSGYQLVSGDFSSIEARILCWYAGEAWKLDAFRDYDRSGNSALDPYLTAAARILKRPIDPEDEISRNLGKICELAFGFGGGLGAWRNFDDSNTHTDADVERYKREWRNANPATVRFWRRLERSIKKAIRTGQRVLLDNLVFALENGTFFLTLPSGRRLAYPRARLVPGKFPDTTDVVFFDNARGGWTETRAWFGIFVENVVSGTARDLLAAALLRIDAADFPIILHVHDEICAQVPEEFRDTEAFQRLMIELPAWATGLPVAAKIRIGKRYSKSKSKPRTDAQVLEFKHRAVDVDRDESEYVDDF